MSRVVVADLDGTLADTRHRRHLCPTVDPARSWHDYAVACLDDPVIPGPVALLRALHAAGCDVHILTNRPVSAVNYTRFWLDQIPDLFWNHLRMSPTAQPGDPVDQAVGYLTELRERHHDVVVFLNDNPAVVLAAESAGFPAVCVNPCYPQRDTT